MRIRMLVKPAIKGERLLRWEYDGPLASEMEMDNCEGITTIKNSQFRLTLPSDQLEAVWRYDFHESIARAQHLMEQ